MFDYTEIRGSGVSLTRLRSEEIMPDREVKTIMKCHECADTPACRNEQIDTKSFVGTLWRAGTPACRNEQIDVDSFSGTLWRAGTLDASDLDNDGELSVLDIDLSREKHG